MENITFLSEEFLVEEEVLLQYNENDNGTAEHCFSETESNNMIPLHNKVNNEENTEGNILENDIEPGIDNAEMNKRTLRRVADSRSWACNIRHRNHMAGE